MDTSDADLLESIVLNAIVKTKQANYDIETLEDTERHHGSTEPPRPRIAISSLLNSPRTDEFVYNSRGRRIHVRTEWNTAYELLGLEPISVPRQGLTTPTKGIVIFVHGMNGHANRPTWAFLAHRLQLAGYHPVGFDFQGHGYSDRYTPGTQNPYYDHTRALINDYTELIDDMLWLISKLFVTMKEKEKENEKEKQEEEEEALRQGTGKMHLWSQYYHTEGGRKRKGRAESISLEELEHHGFDVDTDDLYHDYNLRHRFSIGTPLFFKGVSMGGATALLMSSIMEKLHRAQERADQEGNPVALFADMNAISLEDPEKRTVQPTFSSEHSDSDEEEENSENNDTSYDNDEEDSNSLRKMLVDPFVNTYRFLSREFSAVKTVTAVNTVLTSVNSVKIKVQEKVNSVKSKVEDSVRKVKSGMKTQVDKVKGQVRAVKSRVKGELMDVYQGKVGVHGMGSNVHRGEAVEEDMDWIDQALGYIDSKNKGKNYEPADLVAGEDRGEVIFYNSHEYPREVMLHMGEVSRGFKGAILVSPAIAVDTPHPALVAFLKHIAVPLMPTVVLPQFLRRSDDSTNWSSVSFKSYNKTDGYPDGLSWGENVKFRTAYTILNMIRAIGTEIPHINFPYLAVHDPLDRVTAFSGVVNLMHTAGNKCDSRKINSVGGAGTPNKYKTSTSSSSGNSSSSAKRERSGSLSSPSGNSDLYIRCAGLQSKEPIFVKRQNSLGKLVVVIDGKHDIASNKTDVLLEEVLDYLHERTSGEYHSSANAHTNAGESSKVLMDIAGVSMLGNGAHIDTVAEKEKSTVGNSVGEGEGEGEGEGDGERNADSSSSKDKDNDNENDNDNDKDKDVVESKLKNKSKSKRQRR